MVSSLVNLATPPLASSPFMAKISSGPRLDLLRRCLDGDEDLRRSGLEFR